jgi:LCP family protein required for cell wall assembly
MDMKKKRNVDNMDKLSRSSKLDAKKTTKKHKILKITLLSTLFIVLFSASFVGVYAYNLFNKLETTPIDKTNDALGITQEVEQKIAETKKEDEVINIALFGLDQRDLKEAGRSDSIVIMSIDKAHKKIKLSSIMRDSYVSISGHGKDKINHAYAFGGPQLAIKTLNETYGLNIKDYATVNFFSLAKLIDALGGVTVEVKSYEVNEINIYIKEVADISKSKYTPIKKAGVQNLNGAQAVSYSRIRHVGDGDYERTERQRRVITALMEKVRAAGITKYPDLVNQLLPYVSTSMNSADIVKIGLDVLTSGITTIEQERFPVDGYGDGQMIKGVYYQVFDQKTAKEQMFKYIYEDVKPTPKQ